MTATTSGRMVLQTIPFVLSDEFVSERNPEWQGPGPGSEGNGPLQSNSSFIVARALHACRRRWFCCRDPDHPPAFQISFDVPAGSPYSCQHCTAWHRSASTGTCKGAAQLSRHLVAAGQL